MTTINMFAAATGVGKFLVSKRGKSHTRYEPQVPSVNWQIRLFHNEASARTAINAWKLGIWQSGDNTPEITATQTKTNRSHVNFAIVPVTIIVED